MEGIFHGLSKTKKAAGLGLPAAFKTCLFRYLPSHRQPLAVKIKITVIKIKKGIAEGLVVHGKYFLCYLSIRNSVSVVHLKENKIIFRSHSCEGRNL